MLVYLTSMAIRQKENIIVQQDQWSEENGGERSNTEMHLDFNYITDCIICNDYITARIDAL